MKLFLMFWAACGVMAKHSYILSGLEDLHIQDLVLLRACGISSLRKSIGSRTCQENTCKT